MASRFIKVFIICALAICVAPVMLGCARDDAGEVVVYVAVDRRQSEPILQRFEQQSGLRVRAVYDAEAAKTTGLVTRLLAESGRPRCDVFWNNELVQTLHLSQRGMLEAYRSPQAEDIPAALRDPNGMWTGIATRSRVIVYNTEHVTADEAPRSLFDLTAPQWRGKVAMADPRFGTTRTHIAALFAVLGPQRAQQYLTDLKQNDVRIVDGNAMVKNLVARADPGASPIYVGLTDTDDVLAGQQNGEPVAMVYPDQDSIGTLVVPTTVCLVRGAPHPEAARRLIDYLVGPEVEAQLTAATGYAPVRGKAPAEAGKVEHSSPRAFEVQPQALLEQLQPSSRWTQEHFHP